MVSPEEYLANKNKTSISPEEYLASKEKSPISPEEYLAQKNQNPVTKALGNVLKGTGGLVMGALEKLDRPRSMLVSGIQALKGDRGAGDVWEAAKGNIHPSWSEMVPDINVPVPSISKGHRSDIDIDNEGKTVNVKNAVGFLGDVVLDPINALGIGVLTKSGKGASILKKIGSVYGDDIVKGLLNKSDDAIKFLKSKGVSDDFLKLALEADAPLAKTLPEQAKAGQWAAGRFGPLTTPEIINTPIAKATDATRRSLPKIPVLNKIINRTGDDAFDETLKQIDTQHRIRKNEILDTGRETRKVIDTSDFGDMSSASWYEKGGANATPQQERIKQQIHKLNQSQVDELGKRGIKVEQINQDGYFYVPHVVTPEEAGERFMDRVKSRLSKGPKTKTVHAIEREVVWIKDPMTGGWTLDHLERFSAENGFDLGKLETRQATIDEINKKFGRNVFKGDLAEATTTAAMRNEAAIYGSDQVDFFLKKGEELKSTVTPEKAARLGWRTPAISIPERTININGKEIMVKDKINKLQNTMFPPEISRVIESKWKMVENPDDAMKGMKGVFNAYTSTWKRFTLFPFAEYHFRNMVGDTWNGWMHGWKPKDIPGDLSTAWKIQKTGGKGLSVKSKLYGQVDGETLYKMARDHGVIGTGQWSEISDIMAPISSTKGKNILAKIKKEAWDLDKPTKIGSFLEDNRRLALFKRLVEDGDTFEGAANSVAKTLYDYNDLTDTEKNIRRFAVPFYTWYRKNIPAQFENLIRRPGKVAVLPKFKAAIEGSNKTEYPEKLRPEWMQREFSIHTGEDDKGNENLSVLGGYIPTTDVLKFGGRPEDISMNIASNLNPAWKVPTELGLNRNFFRGTNVDRLRDQEDAGALDYVKGNEMTNYLGMSMPTTYQKLSETLPFTRTLSTLDRMNPFGVFDKYEPDDRGRTRPYHTEMETVPKLVKTLTGWKTYPTDVERDAYGQMRDLQHETERVAGLNLTNIKALARRAMLEGDLKAVEKYEELAEVVISRMEEQEKLYNQYLDSKK